VAKIDGEGVDCQVRSYRGHDRSSKRVGEFAMRRVRYSVAMSLDGYIAGPEGEADWIIMDPAIDFAAFFQEFDTMLLGRRTFEAALGYGSTGTMPGMKAYVCSKTLRDVSSPDVTLVGDAVATVAEMRTESGKDIWLMGGGHLFRSLLEAGLVDCVEVGIIPVLLGQGIPLLPEPAPSVRLELTKCEHLPSGIAMLQYAVRRGRS
jgi:dihydrofolate reductase